MLCVMLQNWHIICLKDKATTLLNYAGKSYNQLLLPAPAGNV